MESAYRRGEKSVLDWIKLHHSDYAGKQLDVDIKEGNPSAASFMKFQAFTTAAVQDQRIRTRIQAALAGNLKRGEGAAPFKKVIDSEFDKAGLSRLNPSQIQNIYDTNTSLAFGAGQMGKMIEVSADFPYWKYSATMDSKTRPDHAALHGKIFRTGDFTFWPPIGFRCRCTAIPLTARQAGKLLESTVPLEGGNKHSMPTPEELKNLRLSNAGFIGNKQQNYMAWIGKEYASADQQTRAYIDQAFDAMKADIDMLNKESLREFFSNDFINKTWDVFRNDKRYTIAAQSAKLTTKQAYFIHAYTQEAPLYKELNGWLFKDIKPNDFSKDQLLTMKRLLTNSLKKLPKHEGVVWRYIEHIDANTLKQYQIDAPIVWDGFSSASTLQNLPGFDDRKYVFMIHSKTSRSIGMFSDHKENETLFAPGTKFKVLDRDEQGDTYFFELEED